MARPNWSRSQPRPLIILKVMTLATLANVRSLIRSICRHITKTSGRGGTSRLN